MLLRIKLLNCVVFLITLTCSSQIKKIDSLHLELNEGASLLNKVNVYNTLGIIYLKINIDSSSYYIDKTIVLAKELKSDSMLAKAYINKGLVYKRKSKNDSSFVYYNKGLLFADKSNNLSVKGKALNNIANFYFLENKFIEAIDFYKKAININNQSINLNNRTKDSLSLLRTKSSLSLVYNKVGFYEEALALKVDVYNYYKFSNAKDTEYCAILLKEIGDIYYFLCKKESIKQSQREGYKINAKQYYDEALKVGLKINNFNFRNSTIYSSLGAFYDDIENDYEKSLYYYNESLKFAKNSKFKYGIAASNSYLAELYAKNGKLDSAYSYARIGFDLAKEINQEKLTHRNAGVLYSYYNFKGDLKKAIHYNEIWKKIEKKYNEGDIERKILLTRFKYEKEVLALDNKLKLKDLRVKKNTVLFVILLIFIILFLTYLSITNRKLNKAYKLEKKASDAKSVFLKQMSHEFKTPLNSIIGFSDLVLSNINNDMFYENAIDCVRNIKESGLILLKDINRVLLAKKNGLQKQKLEVANFSLLSTVKKSIFINDLNLKNKKVKLRFEIDDRLKKAEFEGDSIKLIQVLSNLIDNAIKFTKEGSVKVKVFPLYQSEEGYSLPLRFEVSDTGIGIPAEEFSNIFTEFYQVDKKESRSYEGLGLGLSITNSILKLMGTSLKVKSELGKGSTFYFDLMLVKKTRLKPNFIKEELMMQKKKRYVVLIVEDNKLNIKLTRKIIENNFQQINIIEAHNGEEGYEMFKNNFPDLILMDINMPILSGIDSSKKIREHCNKGKKVPIIFLSASISKEYKTEMEELKINKFIEKPINTSLIVQNLSEFIIN